MRYELYNIFLIKTSERARSEVMHLSSLWSGQSREDLLLWFRRKSVFAELASHFNVDPETGLELLSSHLRHEILSRIAPDFEAEDLLPFLNSEGALSQILNCNPDEVFDHLLDSYELLHTVSKKNYTSIDQKLALLSQEEYFLPPADTLFLSMLAAYKQSTEFSIDGRVEVGRLLDELQLLRGKARVQLRRHAIKKGCLKGKDSGFLKIALDSEVESSSFAEVGFDTIAIIHLRQRITWIVQQMRDEAQELIEGLDQLISKSSYLWYLRAQVEFYQLNAPASAWERTLSHLIEDRSALKIGKDDINLLLFEACKTLKAELITCLILSAINLPSNIDTFGNMPLTFQPPIAPVDSEHDTDFPIGREEILERIRSEYIQREHYELIE